MTKCYYFESDYAQKILRKCKNLNDKNHNTILWKYFYLSVTTRKNRQLMELEKQKNDMKQNVYEIDFVRAFEESLYNKNFSRKGLIALFAHLKELEDQIGEEIELDLVAIASDYVEYGNWCEIEREFNNIITPEMSPESKLKALNKHIEEIVVVDLNEGDIIFNSF